MAIDGEYWIEKDGVLLDLQISGPGPYPRNVTRFNKFLGRSNWLEDTPLIGNITDFQLVNLLGDAPSDPPTTPPSTAAPTAAPTDQPAGTSTSAPTDQPAGTSTKDVLTQCVLQCIDGAFP